MISIGRCDVCGNGKCELVNLEERSVCTYCYNRAESSGVVEPLKITLLFTDFQDIEKYLKNALSPTVVFTGDLDQMQRAAAIESASSINAALKIIKRYNNAD